MQLGGTEGFWDLTAHENLVGVVYVLLLTLAGLPALPLRRSGGLYQSSAIASEIFMRTKEMS